MMEIANNEFKVAIGRVIKKLRQQHHLTREELAKETGLSVHSIRSYELGYRSPNSKATVILERYFKIIFATELNERGNKMTTINERVNQVRKQRGLTQQKFAEMLGISQSHLSGVENRNYNPSVPILKLIAAKFGVNEHWLLTGEGSTDVPAVPAPNGKEQTIIQLTEKMDEFKTTSALVEKQVEEIKALLRVLTA